MYTPERLSTEFNGHRVILVGYIYMCLEYNKPVSDDADSEPLYLIHTIRLLTFNYYRRDVLLIKKLL